MTIADIEKIVCAGEGIDPAVIHCPGRGAGIIQAKYIVIRLAHEFGYSEYAISDYLKCNHTTANHAKHRVMNLYQFERGYAHRVDSYRMQVLNAKYNKVNGVANTDVNIASDQLDKIINQINYVKSLLYHK